MPCRQSRAMGARWRAGLLFLGLSLLTACGGQPMPFPVPESEMGDHPGLFTGEQGTWELLHRDAPPTQQPQP
jgi:hypothetical protein